MYEMSFKDVNLSHQIKQVFDQMVKEVKSAAGWDTDVEIHVEPEVKDKGVYLVSVTVHGLGEKIFVKKRGKLLLSVIKKVRKAVIRQVHRKSHRRLRFRKKAETIAGHHLDSDIGGFLGADRYGRWVW